MGSPNNGNGCGKGVMVVRVSLTDILPDIRAINNHNRDRLLDWSDQVHALDGAGLEGTLDVAQGEVDCVEVQLFGGVAAEGAGGGRWGVGEGGHVGVGVGLGGLDAAGQAGYAAVAAGGETLTAVEGGEVGPCVGGA